MRRKIRVEQSLSLEGDATFHVDTLIGKRNDESLEVFARQLAGLYATISPKPIIVSIAIPNVPKEDVSLPPSKCKKFLKAIYDETIRRLVQD